jgi:hypothetical protein
VSLDYIEKVINLKAQKQNTKFSLEHARALEVSTI